MQQKNIWIGDVEVPIIVDGGEEWFPVSYITTKVLLRSGKGAFINKNNREKYKEHLRVFKIKFGDKNTQSSRCISKEGLILALSTSYIGRLNVHQRISQNSLHKYFGLPLLPTDEQDSNYFNQEWISGYSEYEWNVIESEMNNSNINYYRMCSKCTRHFPLTDRFYSKNNNSSKGFNKVCKVCSGTIETFPHPNKKKEVFEDGGVVKSILIENIVEIYKAYRLGKLKYLPDCYKNKESYLKIIRYLFEEGEINEDNLTIYDIVKTFKLNDLYEFMSTDDLHSELYGEDFYLYSWKYPKFYFKDRELSYEIANNIIKNYIKCNNIQIDNIFTYDFEALFKDCKLTKLTEKDKLYFIVQFFDFKYAGYRFSLYSSAYYNNINNVLFDLRYLIEKDLKLKDEHISLLTRNTIRRHSSSLYTYIFVNKHKSLYDLINLLYPNKFNEEDFEAKNNGFDSSIEYCINEILKENFKNVFYNQRNIESTIRIDNLIPDWFIFSDNGVWIVEYFGLYDENQYGEYNVITEYIDKTKLKLKRYKKVNGYKFLFLYPSDIKKNYKGVYKVINKVIADPNYTML